MNTSWEGFQWFLKVTFCQVMLKCRAVFSQHQVFVWLEYEIYYWSVYVGLHVLHRRVSFSFPHSHPSPYHIHASISLSISLPLPLSPLFTLLCGSSLCPRAHNAAPWPICSWLCENIFSFLLVTFLQPCCVLVSWALQDRAPYWCKPLNSCYVSIFGNIPVIELSVSQQQGHPYTLSAAHTHHHRSCQHHLLISPTDAQAWSFLPLSLFITS